MCSTMCVFVLESVSTLRMARGRGVTTCDAGEQAAGADTVDPVLVHCTLLVAVSEKWVNPLSNVWRVVAV